MRVGVTAKLLAAFGFGAALGSVALSPDVSNATTVSAFFSGENDCSGYFGTGFGSCTIFINSGGQSIQLSPVIIKFNGGNLTVNKSNAAYPSVSGTEFSFSNLVSSGDNANISGNFQYAPGTNDPGVRYWAAKAGSDFLLFWDVANTAASSCTGNSANSLNYNLTCLQAAQTVTSGAWSTPGEKELSHLTFYDSVPPGPVPLPGALPLLVAALGALLGFFGWRRRRAAA